MTSVTRHALRVYAALSGLRGNNADVLDALIPFFDPVLEQLDGAVFSPNVFATGVHFLYGWRFTKDIAEHFIPRLLRKGFLERVTDGRDSAYIVRYQRPAAPAQEDIVEILERIIDEFEKFPPRVTDLLTYERTRDQLKDILVRFLVSMDAYDPAALQAKSGELVGDDRDLLIKLENEEAHYTRDDRYMAARFVKALITEKPDWIPHLARLAAIGLLTEVVEDFVKPVQPVERVNLTVIVDAPLALDYLGCSGIALQRDVKSIFAALQNIGCNFVVFPASCLEMRRNLTSMLSYPKAKRYGYTHEAMAKGEVLEDYVEMVANDPEGQLENAGIRVKPLSIEQFPNSHAYFDREHYNDFFESVHWVPEIEPREHDATCLALTMRLREGRHSSDVFRCGYVFVTRNSKFVRASRDYCLSNRFISQIQQGPLIHHRELATIAWLRTGLGAEDDRIPLTHLLATCDRVLQIRTQVPDAVAAKLKQVTPQKLEQFELLLLDHRSMRKLADETLNDETVVTAENAEHLLEVMRRATAEEVRIEYEGEIKRREAKHRELRRQEREATKVVIEERDATIEDARYLAQEASAQRDGAVAELESFRQREWNVLAGVAASVNHMLVAIDTALIALMIIVVVVAGVQNIAGWPANSRFWNLVIDGAGLLGAYHLVTALSGRHMMNLTTLLNLLSPLLIQSKLDQLNMDHIPLDRFEFKGGRVEVKLPSRDPIKGEVS